MIPHLPTIFGCHPSRSDHEIVLKPMDPSVPSKMPSLGGPGREVSSLQIFTYLKYFEMIIFQLENCHYYTVFIGYQWFMIFPMEIWKTAMKSHGKSSCYQRGTQKRAGPGFKISACDLSVSISADGGTYIYIIHIYIYIHIIYTHDSHAYRLVYICLYICTCECEGESVCEYVYVCMSMHA